MPKLPNEIPTNEREGGAPSGESPPPSPALSDAKAAVPTLLTPHEHAVATGNTQQIVESVRIGGRPDQKIVYSLAHSAASRLHGWDAHAYHAGEPIKLARAAYEAALKAALAPVTRAIDARGKRSDPLDAEQVAKITNERITDPKADPKPTLVTDYEPHPAAHSKYAPNFKASAA